MIRNPADTASNSLEAVRIGILIAIALLLLWSCTITADLLKELRFANRQIQSSQSK